MRKKKRALPMTSGTNERTVLRSCCWNLVVFPWREREKGGERERGEDEGTEGRRRYEHISTLLSLHALTLWPLTFSVLSKRDWICFLFIYIFYSSTALAYSPFLFHTFLLCFSHRADKYRSRFTYPVCFCFFPRGVFVLTYAWKHEGVGVRKERTNKE